MRLQMELTVISTFAGCGGSSLGYKKAGYKELLAIDFNKNAVETFKLNFPEVPVWERDITKVSADEILKFCKIKKGELDILDGSPPCQGFSTAGKRNVNDSRNILFEQFVRLINDLQPKVFIMENVSGMVKGKMKGMFIEIINQLKSLNYNVKCKLLNAKFYEVPQSRERLFFIGVRKDLNIEPSFPIPSKKVITVKEAIKNIKLSEIKLPKGEIEINYNNTVTVTTLGNASYENLTIFETGGTSAPIFERIVFNNVLFDLDVDSATFTNCEFRNCTVIERTAGTVTFGSTCKGSGVYTSGSFGSAPINGTDSIPVADIA